MTTYFHSGQIFTVEIAGRPVVAFNADSAEDAVGFCALPEFRQDLAELTSDGVSLYESHQALIVRAADCAEIAAFERGAGPAPRADGPTMVFLIQVDGLKVIMLDRD